MFTLAERNEVTLFGTREALQPIRRECLRERMSAVFSTTGSRVGDSILNISNNDQT